MITIPSSIPIGADWLRDVPQVNGYQPNDGGPVIEVVTKPANPQNDLFAVEWLFANVQAHHLGNGTPTNKRARNWVQKVVGQSTDDAGHIVGKNQGGSGTDLWNLFPQNGNFNRGVYAAHVERTINDAAAHGAVQIWFRFYFEDMNMPYRATRFSFFILYPDGALRNDDLLNP